jgi:hypothetical protein
MAIILIGGCRTDDERGRFRTVENSAGQVTIEFSVSDNIDFAGIC